MGVGEAVPDGIGTQGDGNGSDRESVAPATAGAPLAVGAGSGAGEGLGVFGTSIARGVARVASPDPVVALGCGVGPDRGVALGRGVGAIVGATVGTIGVGVGVGAGLDGGRLKLSSPGSVCGAVPFPVCARAGPAALARSKAIAPNRARHKMIIRISSTL